jgi:hypothetical protein
MHWREVVGLKEVVDLTGKILADSVGDKSAGSALLDKLAHRSARI